MAQTNGNDPIQTPIWSITNIGDCEKAINYNTDTPGLTKLEYFAAMALQGLMANPNFSNMANFAMAEVAVHAADTLINELNRKS